MTKNYVDKSGIDVSRTFLIYMALCGDVERTAAACDLDPQLVFDLANQEGWIDKIARVSLLHKSGKPGDFEKSINRSINFCQAHRMRALVERLILRFEKQTTDEMVADLSNVKDGTLSARFFIDLASAMEKVQALTYLALGDSVRERELDESGEDRLGVTAVHAAVIAALSNPLAKGIESELLVADAARTVIELAPIKTEGEPPLSKDDSPMRPETAVAA